MQIEVLTDLVLLRRSYELLLEWLLLYVRLIRGERRWHKLRKNVFRQSFLWRSTCGFYTSDTCCSGNAYVLCGASSDSCCGSWKTLNIQRWWLHFEKRQVLLTPPGRVAGAAGSAPGPAVRAGPASGAGPLAGNRRGLPGDGPGLFWWPWTRRRLFLPHRGGAFLAGALLVPGPLVETRRLSDLVEQRTRPDAAFAFNLHPHSLCVGALVLLNLGLSWSHRRHLHTLDRWHSFQGFPFEIQRSTSGCDSVCVLWPSAICGGGDERWLLFAWRTRRFRVRVRGRFGGIAIRVLRERRCRDPLIRSANVQIIQRVPLSSCSYIRIPAGWLDVGFRVLCSLLPVVIVSGVILV